ncbi:hypothetical protein MHK_008889 [Candidatus Magnetomorum sp. HK-1]|nr:hypothetical protein MHK_008889 [Candidatus Magnetomorum sp. HK-1]
MMIRQMAKLDKIKEEIGWLKVIFSILIAIDLSLVGWLAQNYIKAALFLMICCVLGVFIVTSVIIWVNRTAYQKIDELEEL